MIEKYNQIIRDIVKAYAIRHYKELYDEELDDLEYRHSIDIMEYRGVAIGPINISDDYYNLEDILLAEHLRIPCKIVREYNDRCLERYQEGKERDCNLCSFWERYYFYKTKND